MPSTLEQEAVVSNLYENKLVCALPGSGKTHTTVNLAERITQIPDSKVLMVTFTNAGVEEMKHRIATRLSPVQANRIEIKTFAKIMIEQFRALDSTRKIILGAQLTNYYHRTARKLKIKQADIGDFENSSELIGRSYGPLSVPSAHQGFYEELQRSLKKFKRIDLNSIAKEVVAALEQDRIPLLPHTHFIVDEFQDTDELQLQWLLAHKREGRFFCVVGDDDQSIYSWRGAKGYLNMVRYQEEFEAEGYLLSKCFRCAPPILGLAQQLIEFNESRIAKDMASMKNVHGKVTCLVTPTNHVSPFTQQLERAEILNCKQEVPHFMRDSPIDTYRHVVDSIESHYENLAILCRTNKHLDGLEYCLSERGIGTVRIGGRSIFENPHTVGFANLLIGFVFPKHRQMLVEGLAWLGIEECILEYINSLPPSNSLLKTAANQSDSQTLNSLSSLRDRFLNFKPSVSEINPQLLSLVETHFSDNKDDSFIYRMSSVRTVLGILGKRSGSFGERIKSLQGMMMKSDNKAEYRQENKVVLCTMTSAKGLEFERVLVAMLNRQIIPSQPEEASTLEHIEEERRLLYVAMTRAEEELILHFNEKAPSRFIKELDLA